MSLGLRFDNSYARLPDELCRGGWSQRLPPEPLSGVRLISLNEPLARELGLNLSELSPEALINAFTSEALTEGAEPLAMKYAGHQFGHYNPSLGDGRGLLLGEHLSPSGVRWDLHLKGAGRTHYSRSGDGRAVLRSSVREHLVSEAMWGLGLPTTRSLCLFGSEQMTYRQGLEPCALVVRATPCHIRFGHFEHLFYTAQHEALEHLSRYVIERYYMEHLGAPNPHEALYQEVVERSARLVALWQAYGFVHGVMNTDNMSILGETFDYGPYTFMDRYEPWHVANKNDTEGRYAFERQPLIMRWNVAMLGRALSPLVPLAQQEAQLSRFEALYQEAYMSRMRARLGLQTARDDDASLVRELLASLALGGGDLNRTLRALSDDDTLEGGARGEPSEGLLSAWGRSRELKVWCERLRGRRALEPMSRAERLALCHSVNPLYVLRNYMAEEAIYDAQRGDDERVNTLLTLLQAPFTPHEGCEHLERYAGEPPSWASQIRLTCSS